MTAAATAPDPEALGLTMLGCVSLILNHVTEDNRLGQDLTPILTAARLRRVRDDLEAYSLTGAPLDLPREDSELILLALVATQRLLEDGGQINAVPDLQDAVSLPQVRVAVRHVMDVLDRPPRLVVQQQGGRA